MLPGGGCGMGGAAGNEELIGGQYAVDFARNLPGAGGGLPAFAVRDRRTGAGGLMAVQVRRSLPPRARTLSALLGASIDGVLLPVAHGPAIGPRDGAGYFIVCQAPPGPALALDRPWTEGELIEDVLRPVAAALDALHARGVTHRAIRPDNLFRAASGGPALLGCAWAAPPASLQPALYEPPYSACCLPAGRGEGGIADDVYALGVTLLALALGRVPLGGMDEEAVLRRKLDAGSFAALCAGERLPPFLADLLRGMLAEDPNHRPPPVLLTNPAAARGRRVATRPPRRAQWKLDDGGVPVWNTRGLAHAIGRNPALGTSLLRGGAVGDWVRRGVGDPALAARLDEAMRSVADPPVPGEVGRADAALLMRACAMLDPLAPLWWRGVALWPDGLGPALAEASVAGASHAAALEELVATEAMPAWAAALPERADLAALRQEARQHRLMLQMRGPEGGMPRLCHALNPLLPCASPCLEGHWVARAADLLPALEAASRQPELRRMPPVDRHIAAFVAASGDAPAERHWGSAANGVESPAAQLRLLARLQDRYRMPHLPGLTRWMAEQCMASSSSWRNRSRRQRMEEAFAAIQDAGRLRPLLDLIDDPAAREADEHGLREAEAALRRIDAELRDIAVGAPARADTARRLGQEIAAGSGVLAVILATVGVCVL